MKNKKYFICSFIFVFLFLLSACGSNYVAKNLGGTTTVNLDEDKKLMEVTWKEDSLWILTRPMRDGEFAETYEFQENSNFGVLEGKVILVESVSKD